jgi:predicted enzyme related to lactoylglutathione lyase
VVVPRLRAQFEAPGGGRIALQFQQPDTDDPPLVCVGVGELRDFVRELEARGVKVISPVTAQDFGDSALIEDPSGNVIALIDLATSEMRPD